MKEKILLSLTFGILLLSIAPSMIEFVQSSETTYNYNPVLPFGGATVFASSNSDSTVLSFSNSATVSSFSATTTIGNSITLDIFETNDGTNPLTDPIVTSDNALCNPVYVDGDVNNDGILDPGEQWHYTCDVVSAVTGIFGIILTGFGTAPDNTVITWPGDPEERIVGTVEVILGKDAPKILKQNTRDELSALVVTDKRDQKRIDRADKAIGQSLDDRLWQDDYTLTKHGKKVFDKEKKAVRQLIKVKSVDVSDIITALVTVDKSLAQYAIDSIPTDTGDKKIDKKLAKANKEMKKGQEHIEEDEPDKAINHYKKAWKYAQNALKRLGSHD